MDVKKLVRDASKVHASLSKKGDALITTKGCKIYIPSRFTERKLASITGQTRVVGIFAIVVEDRFYGVSTVNAMMQLTPTITNLIKIDEDEYFEFIFEKGAEVIPNINLLKDNQLCYTIYDEIIAKGNIPWYILYEDLGKLFVTSRKHANLKLGVNNIPLEMIAANVARNPKDRTKYYRHSIQKIDEQIKNPPAYVPFRSVQYGATNTTSKLMGAYFDEGLTSALINPSQKTEGVETLLRM